MQTFVDGMQLLRVGETALFICTDGTHLEIRLDGTGESAFWVLSPREEVKKVVIYKQLTGNLNKAEILVGRCIGYRSVAWGTRREQGKRRYRVLLEKVRLAGTTRSLWSNFVAGGRNPIRYLSRQKFEPSAEEKLLRRVLGGGFGTPAENRRIEVAAIRCMIAQYKREGWQVRSVEDEHCGYDLLCSKGKREVHLEVKGIAGTRPLFMITVGERSRAESDRVFRLCIVTEALTSPKLTTLSGRDLHKLVTLYPLVYRAEIQDTPGATPNKPLRLPAGDVRAREPRGSRIRRS
jgi:hypothetical protein